MSSTGNDSPSRPGERRDRPVELAEHRWPNCSVLVIHADASMRSDLERMLARRCGMVQSAPDVGRAAQLRTRLHFDLVILGDDGPQQPGLADLHALRELGHGGDVILITSAAVDVASAIEAMRAGAADLIFRPLRAELLLDAVRRSFERAQAVDARALPGTRRLPGVRASGAADGLVGHSAAMQQLRSLIRRIGPTASTVLLLGESGTGKEVVARALHRASARAQAAFIAVNCAAIAPELIESELFGHVKGAFTGAVEQRDGLFAAASGGTLFLDEISELPLSMQARLLRVLEERRLRPVGAERERAVDVRIIAASNRDLAAEVAAGRFRHDLYYRLAVVDIVIAPLRERGEDVAELAAHFMRELAATNGIEPLPLTRELVQRLGAHEWPGNVRELRNFIERSLILGGFAPLLPPAPAPELAALVADEAELSLEAVVRRHIERVTAACGGNKAEAARRLGVSRRTLERKFAEWNDNCPDEVPGPRQVGSGR